MRRKEKQVKKPHAVGPQLPQPITEEANGFD
jgi:hypothetical protein